MPKTRKNPPQIEATEPPQKQILTARDVAAVLGLSANRVHQMLAAGELPSVRVGSKGGGVRIPRQAFDAYLAALNASACASVTPKTHSVKTRSLQEVFAGLEVPVPAEGDPAQGSALALLLDPARQEGVAESMALYLRNSASRR